MFDPDFYPTPANVITAMLGGYSLEGKVILDPQAGKGDIVDYCHNAGAQAIACEKQQELKKILQTKCNIIADDFLTLTGDKISHIDMIVMNPPFSQCEKHILHAYEIAPVGCDIITLCNESVIKNSYSNDREQIENIVKQNGSYELLGDCFSTAERSTNVKIALLRIKKPGQNYQSEFEGFFMDEEIEMQGNGLMPYNFVRDLVNRYVAAIKIYDDQLDAAVKINNLTSSFYKSDLSFCCTEKSKPVHRNEFKKDLQKSAWKFIFNTMKMDKYITEGVKSDINKFVEQQANVPFTMRNIYRMLEIIAGTHNERMDRAILDVFHRLTYYHADNRYCVEGWKTNSHYLIGQKFILPYMLSVDSYRSDMHLSYSSGNIAVVDDMMKALCYINGQNYDNYGSFRSFIDTSKNSSGEYIRYEFGVWYDWGFFEIKGFKKGTIHFKFKDLDVWGRFNQEVARLKGYPLFEDKNQTEYQKRNTGKPSKKNAA